MSRDWIRQPERGTVFWLRVITWIALKLGRPVAFVLLYPITLYFYLTSPITRRASREFLQRATGGRVSAWQVFLHHRFFAATILDRVYLLSGRESLFRIQTCNAEAVLAYLDRGQGCILLGSHLGSFEVLRAVGVRQYGKRFQLRILMQEEQNRSITRFLNLLAPEVARTVIPTGRPDTMLRVKECLDGGNLVALLADRVNVADKSLPCDFLGKPALFPRGPAMLALALQVPVFTCFGLYLGGNRYQVRFDLLSEPLAVPRKDRRKMIRRLTCRYAQRLQEYAKQYPYNWFNFYDFW